MSVKEFSIKMEEKFHTFKESIWVRHEKPISKYCERSRICKKFGRVGHEHFSEYRGLYMTIGLICCFIQLLLNSLALISLSTSEGAIRAFNWAALKTTEPDPSNTYYQFTVGLRAYILEDFKSPAMVVHWKDNSCLGKGTGPCNKCKTAALGSITGVCLGLVTTLLRIRNCMRRGKSKNDRYCYKSFAMCNFKHNLILI